MDFIAVNEPLLNGREREYLLQCVDTGWISSEGPFVGAFEGAFAAVCRRQHGFAVCNGSVALELAFDILDLAPGDEVILPAFCIISCAQAVIRAGATPVLVDCDGDAWNMTAEAVKKRLTPRTRAVLAVHTYGLPVDMGPLAALCREHGLLLVEDAAEAIGQECRGLPCGSFGDVSVFSFYANKHVTTGEGGMVLVDDAIYAQRCRDRRNLCFGRGHDRFVHERLGWNMRMCNLQAAVGLAQVERLESIVARKRGQGRLYDSLLAGLPGVRLPVPRTAYAENIYWVYGLVLDDDHPLDAARACDLLAEHGVGTRPFFHPMHEQPVLRSLGLFAGERYPESERLARKGFYIPSGLALTPEQQEHVARAVRQVLS